MRPPLTLATSLATSPYTLATPPCRYHEAAALCPEWEKAHFHLGRYYDGLLRRELKWADRTKQIDPRADPCTRSCPTTLDVKPAVRQQRMLQAYKGTTPNRAAPGLPEVLKHYGAALRRGGKYAPQALPRMLTLWLDAADLASKARPAAISA